MLIRILYNKLLNSRRVVMSVWWQKIQIFLSWCCTTSGSPSTVSISDSRWSPPRHHCKFTAPLSCHVGLRHNVQDPGKHADQHSWVLLQTTDCRPGSGRWAAYNDCNVRKAWEAYRYLLADTRQATTQAVSELSPPEERSCTEKGRSQKPPPTSSVYHQIQGCLFNPLDPSEYGWILNSGGKRT